MKAKFSERFMAGYHHLADKDFIWFPFVVLKPAPHEPIGLPKLILMILGFGLYGAILWPLWQFLAGHEFTLRNWGSFALKSVVFFTVWFSCLTVPLWNRRARSLRSS